MLWIKLIFLLLFTSCNGTSNFEALFESPDSAASGDIIIISGGTVASTATPFPLHKATLFDSNGNFKRFLYNAKDANERLSGGAVDSVTGDLLLAIDTVDRIDRVDLNNFQVFTQIVDANLTGTMKAIESLSDGSILVTDSATAIEKYSAAGVRAGAPFPLTIPTAINNIKRISGNRFVVTFTTNPDYPRIYNNDGTAFSTATFGAGSPCTTNCDPWDVVELNDGRFVVNSRVTNGLYIYSSTFAYLGVLYLNTAIMQAPSGMAVLANGNLLVCNTTFNTCEEFSISGTVGTRVGSVAKIDNASAMRQPMSVMVVP